MTALSARFSLKASAARAVSGCFLPGMLTPSIHQSINPSIHLAGVGVEFGHGEKLVAGLFDGVFHRQSVEQRALGLLLAGGDFDQAAKSGGQVWDGWARRHGEYFLERALESLACLLHL
jgi:hypothetical protein